MCAHTCISNLKAGIRSRRQLSNSTFSNHSTVLTPSSISYYKSKLQTEQYEQCRLAENVGRVNSGPVSFVSRRHKHSEFMFLMPLRLFFSGWLSRGQSRVLWRLAISPCLVNLVPIQVCNLFFSGQTVSLYENNSLHYENNVHWKIHAHPSSLWNGPDKLMQKYPCLCMTVNYCTRKKSRRSNRASEIVHSSGFFQNKHASFICIRFRILIQYTVAAFMSVWLQATQSLRHSVCTLLRLASILSETVPHQFHSSLQLNKAIRCSVQEDTVNPDWLL